MPSGWSRPQRTSPHDRHAGGGRCLSRRRRTKSSVKRASSQSGGQDERTGEKGFSIIPGLETKEEPEGRGSRGWGWNRWTVAAVCLT